VNALLDMAHTCREKGILLVVVESPIYAGLGDDRTRDIVKEIVRGQNGLYFDYASSPEFVNHRTYFADELHLNDLGARRFSEMLAKQIVVEMESASGRGISTTSSAEPRFSATSSTR
jgi:hypothetical protein